MITAGDNPITKEEQDVLNRHPTAVALAREIKRVDSSEGYVFGIVGPWGSGKTSLLNLMKLELDKDADYTVVNFNPWMFTGTEQLVNAFFHELSSQLNESNSSKFGAISTTVDTYANLFSPITLIPGVGAWYERLLKITKAARQYADNNRPSVEAKRHELRKLLSELDTPIVVTIDDIDRLSSDEIKSLFKLVRLTGNFPKLVYVLAFDRSRVENALQDGGVDGRAYLEKIVQHGIRVPEVPKIDLVNALGAALSDNTSEIDSFTHFNQDYWTDVLAEVVAPLLRNMRDVRRYASAFGATARDLHHDIEATDLLALEAVRVFLPDKFDSIANAHDALTTLGDRQQDELKQKVLQIVGDDEPDSAVLKSLIGRVFPAAARYWGGTSYDRSWASQWLRDRRVAHPDVLQLYLERVTPADFENFIEAEQAYALLTDQDALDRYLRSLDPGNLDRVISALLHFENDFEKSAVVPSVTVLLNLIGDLPIRPRSSFFDLDPDTHVRSTVFHLLKLLDEPSDAMSAVSEILPNLISLSSKFLLISMVGHREGTGHGLVNENDASTLEQDITGQIEQATPERLSTEWDLLRLLSTPSYWGVRQGPAVTDFSSSPLHRAILLKSRSNVRSQMVGNRAVHITPTLYWDTLERMGLLHDQVTVAVTQPDWPVWSYSLRIRSGSSARGRPGVGVGGRSVRSR
ncbi:P-loop NTPase fold protein [Mycolicibacterium sp. Y3]